MPGLFRMVGRALIRRCPRCGQNKIFRRWLTLAPHCPRCGLLFEREEGYWTGAIGINCVITELLFVLIFVATIALTLPDVPWTPLLIAAIAVNVTFPFFFYPMSKTCWMAMDLHFNPLEEWEELETGLRRS
jgi:uncharacterized protein (DUF983 family)